jgi:hypothetical protein
MLLLWELNEIKDTINDLKNDNNATVEAKENMQYLKRKCTFQLAMVKFCIRRSLLN